MSKEKRETGKLIRDVEKLDKKWRAENKAEGKTANKLAMKLGIAARAGLRDKAKDVRGRD